jgi:hypothetical protein
MTTLLLRSFQISKDGAMWKPELLWTIFHIGVAWYEKHVNVGTHVGVSQYYVVVRHWPAILNPLEMYVLFEQWRKNAHKQHIFKLIIFS